MYAGAYIQRCKGSVTDMGKDEYVSGFFIKGIPKIHSPPPKKKNNDNSNYDENNINENKN